MSTKMDIEGLTDYFGQTGQLIGAREADSRVPDGHGLYSIHIDDVTKLRAPFSDYMFRREHDMIYFGKAQDSYLSKRLVKNDLQHSGHGSFFRSLGAVLGFTPRHGSLIGKKNQTNYKFEGDAKEEILDWINEHLSVRCTELEPADIAYEPALIGHFRPVLNDTYNPDVLSELRHLRARCRAIARGEVESGSDDV